jgi:DNA-binding MarR family transcriptional regulator
MKAISEAFHIKLSTLTSIIDKAEGNRIVRRVNSKKDRRVVFLETTKKRT